VIVGRREVAALYRKELRQVGRSRGALISAGVLSLLMIVVVPSMQLAAIAFGGSAVRPLPPLPLPGLADLGQPTRMFTHLMLPMFVALGGILVPSIAAVHTVVVERERRSIELLIALPVRVGDILAAKLAANLTLALATLGPLLLIDVVALTALGLATPGYVASLYLVLLGALACSIGISLVVALLARDFRTANNVNGVLIGPLIMVVLAVLLLAPGAIQLPALAGVLLLIGAVALVGGLRWLTFERYLA
jgi:ABC-type transport system involved in multi-copper enzyme maturation permease subunit